MKYITKILKSSLLLLAAVMLILASCNKDVEQFTETPVTPPTGKALGETIAGIPTDSLYYRLIARAGLVSTINNKATSYTMFVPDNNAMKVFINAISLGQVPIPAPDAVFSGFISTKIPAATAAGIVSYNITSQTLLSAGIPATFPNLQYPTILNPAPSVSALLRLTTFPTTRNGAWLNNIPLTSVDMAAVNGVIHHTALVVTPPQKFLWDRISTDTALTYLKAAINRADSGTAAPGTLQSALLNIGANLTVFAPTDAAFKTTLTGAIYKGVLPQVVQQLTAAYMGGGMSQADAAALAATNAPPIAIGQASALASTPDVFNNPLLFSVLTAQTVKGIVVYHILGNRAYTNNFPTTTTNYPTLLNGAVPTHPGVGLTAVFGAPFVSSATVKGLGNATAANLIINASPLLPDPIGTSDQNYLNGVIHKIDQVLLPLPL
jgi:uncharacterized surface protein with fasciclin (FAS1) repeats